VDDTTPVFTQADVFCIGGYLAYVWDVEVGEGLVDDIESAVRFALNRDEVV
jgi:hypothetical protein